MAAAGPLSAGTVADFDAQQDGKGIVYLARIPPYMTPTQVRQMMQEYGQVGRVFLQPEDPLVQKRRVKSGGSKRTNYTEGWVEFEKKRIAKRVALALNNRSMSKKRGAYAEDLWNVRYLSKFKWHHLTDRIAYEQKVREHRLQTEFSQAKRESAFFIEQAEKARRMKRYREAHADEFEEEEDRAGGDGGDDDDDERAIPQRKVRRKEQAPEHVPDEVLRKILKKKK